MSSDQSIIPTSTDNKHHTETLEQKKVGFISLGCPKALVDSERIITDLKGKGYDIAPSYDGADVVVVNTCGFIDEAKAESLEAINEAMNKNGKVIVTGCLGKEQTLLKENFPDILSVTGPQAYSEVVDAVQTYAPMPEMEHNPFLDLLPPQGIKLTPPHYSYLKISEGCNHKCSFCIIPSMRGKLVSRTIDDVMREAENLVKGGVKELLIVSQDTSAYGLDLKYPLNFHNGQPLKTSMQGLIEGLNSLGVWSRLHYVYPYPHVDNIIEHMSLDGVLPYLDIPFQHASPTILKNMRRPGSFDKMIERIQKWRQMQPELTLRSTFIVGFPGETEDDFEMLLDFIKEAQIDRAGAFKYSPVEGATANNLPNPVPEEIKAERLERFMQVQAEISYQKLQAKVGSTQRIIVDGFTEDDCVIGRTRADAPEIDGQVIVDNIDLSQSNIKIGDFIDVNIFDNNEHDLFGEI